MARMRLKCFVGSNFLRLAFDRHTSVSAPKIKARLKQSDRVRRSSYRHRIKQQELPGYQPEPAVQPRGSCPTWHSLDPPQLATAPQPGDDGSAADAAARAPALADRCRAASQRGLPATHSQAGDITVRPDAADAARDAHATDAKATGTEHAAVDARARAVFFARPTNPRPHARRPLGLKVGRAVPALGADDAPILRAVGAGVAEF